MASYAGMTVDKNGYVQPASKTDKQIASEAASLVNPVYQQQAVNQAATNAANTASQTALQQGTANTYNVSRDTLKQAGAAETARQKADVAKRGITLNRANMQNLTGAAQTKSILNLTEEEKRQIAGLGRQAAVLKQQADQANKDMDYAKASQLTTQAAALKAQGQERFAKYNQTIWQAKHPATTGGGGGGGNNGGFNWDDIVVSSDPDINTVRKQLENAVNMGLMSEAEAYKRYKNVVKNGVQQHPR